MQVTIYSTLKWRLQTVELEFTDENTTWFDNRIDTDSPLEEDTKVKMARQRL